MKNKKALLVIDMQKGSFTQNTPRYDTKGTVHRINELTQLFRVHNFPILFIQHDGTQTNEFIPNTNEWELLDDLVIEPNDILINKYANDVFYNSQLQSKLIALNTDELYIVGCATDFCIEATIQSALTKDYNIIVVENGHTTGDRPHLNAKKIIEHYNWVWKNMIPTKGKVEVKDLIAIKKESNFQKNKIK